MTGGGPLSDTWIAKRIYRFLQPATWDRPCRCTNPARDTFLDLEGLEHCGQCDGLVSESGGSTVGAGRGVEDGPETPASATAGGSGSTTRPASLKPFEMTFEFTLPTIDLDAAIEIHDRILDYAEAVASGQKVASIPDLERRLAEARGAVREP